MPVRLASILHGAYGDYYEQLVCLKEYKRQHADTALVLFFASPSRHRELSVLDLTFAEEVHPVADIEAVAVDRFLQFQVRDPELQAEVISKLSPAVMTKLDVRRQIKPWTILRFMPLPSETATIGLTEDGQRRLAECMAASGLGEELFARRPTVGFLWRYRSPGGAISPRLQTPEDVVLRTKSELLRELASRWGAHVIIAGMNVRRTEENWDRIEAKFTERQLDVDPSQCTYLRGVGWALELEILRRCSLCLTMPSGFSEALWMRRRAPTLLVDPPPAYVLKALWNRMPLFGLAQPREVLFQFRQPHTAARVLRRLEERGLVPLRPLPA